MNLNRRATVLQRILLTVRLTRKLTRLTNRHHAGAGSVRERRSQQETASLNTSHHIKLTLKTSSQLINARLEHLSISEESGHIVKEDTLVRVIRNRSASSRNQLLNRGSRSLRSGNAHALSFVKGIVPKKTPGNNNAVEAAYKILPSSPALVLR